MKRSWRGLAWLWLTVAGILAGARPSLALDQAVWARVRAAPLSCAADLPGLAEATACRDDAGAFQIARLGLAVESLGASLQALAPGLDTAKVQQVILSDVRRFGAHAAIVAPAMALTDLGSLAGGPFGGASDRVAGNALISLGYLYPKLLDQMRYDPATLARATGRSVWGGPVDFSQFMNGAPDGGMASLDRFREFSAPPGVAPVIAGPANGLGGPDTLGQPGGAAGFRIPGVGTPAARSAPVAWAFVSAGFVAQRSGWRLSEASGRTAPGAPVLPGRDRLAETPFGGVACVLCSDPGTAPALDRSKPPVLDPRSIAGLGAGGEASGVDGRDFNGTEFLAASRGGNAGLASAGSDSLGANHRDLGCELACYVYEVGKTASGVFAEFRQNVTSPTTEGSKEHYDKMWEEVGDGLKKLDACSAVCAEVVPPAPKEPERQPLSDKGNEPDNGKEPEKPKPGKSAANAMTAQPDATGGSGEPPGPTVSQQCKGANDPACGCGVDRYGEVTACAPGSSVTAAWIIGNTQPGQARDVSFLVPDATGYRPWSPRPKPPAQVRERPDDRGTRRPGEPEIVGGIRGPASSASPMMPPIDCVNAAGGNCAPPSELDPRLTAPPPGLPPLPQPNVNPGARP